MPIEPLALQADEAVLRLPLHELVARTDDDLEHRDFYRRAARSSLYGPRWRAAGVRLDRLLGREALRLLPFVGASDLMAVGASAAGLRKALLTRPRTWVTSRGGPSGPKKWLPLTLDDAAHWLSRAQRAFDLVTQPGDGAAPALMLALNEPMPRVSNALPYLWERSDYLAGGRRFEFIIAAMAMLWRNHWDRFALQKQPCWLASSVADARRLAHEMGADAHRLMRSPARGLFWGESLPEARAELEETFRLEESFSLYLSAECREMYCECPAHAGLHLWMDGTLHEIVPDGAAETGEGACFVDQAPDGAEGEYVVTTLGDALPLVRYRTGDRIRVVSTAPCACGITHPRVHFVGRVDAPGAA